MAEEHKEGHGGGHGDAHGEEGHAKGHKGHGGGHHAHGGGHDEHGGVAEWLISFADNVALLMGFFVILLAMNMQKKTAGGIGGAEKNPAQDDSLNELVYGIRQAFNNLPSLESKDPKDGPLVEYMKRRQQGDTSVTGVPGLNAQQQAIRPSDYNAVTASFAFDTNSTTLSSMSKETAQNVASKQRGQSYIVEVRGHVSAIEAASGVDSAMKLSFARAQAVAAALVSNGLKWSNLRVVACGDHERKTPIAYDAGGHKTNQRVEIIVTNETVAADPHTKEDK